MSEQMTQDNIKALTSAKIKLYEQYVDWSNSGKPGVDGTEARFYLLMWLDVEQKQYQWDALSTQQRAEVVSAFYDCR